MDLFANRSVTAEHYRKDEWTGAYEAASSYPNV